MQQRDIFQKIAIVSAAILWIFILFTGGLLYGQTDGFQKTWTDFKSGVLAAEMLPYAKDGLDKQLTVWQDEPHALDGGMLLIASHFTGSPSLFLVGEDGHILHQWDVERKIFNTDAAGWWNNGVTAQNGIFSLEDAHLLPGGDVLFVQTLPTFDNYNGQRLARMDRDSHIIWQVPGAFNHEFDIAGNPQSVYASQSFLVQQLPLIGPPLKNTRYLDDRVEQYSLDGKKLHEWPVADAFMRSRYRDFLLSYEVNLAEQRVKNAQGEVLYDLLHLNSVQYLDAAKAKALPNAQAGDLLLSMRGLNAIAVLRPATGSIVWASRGPWSHQHHAQVEEDGRLYIYDNEGSPQLRLENGSPKDELQSRVIAYNPFTNEMQVVWASPDIHSVWRGYFKPLAAGKWLVAGPQTSRVQVISPQRHVIWELRGVPDRARVQVPYLKQISTVRYYPANAWQ
jgi:hypothetical protein